MSTSHAPLFSPLARDETSGVRHICLFAGCNVSRPDVLLTGASIPTLLAKIPFNGPMAGVRGGLLATTFCSNPSYARSSAVSWIWCVAAPRPGVMVNGRKQLLRTSVSRSDRLSYNRGRADKAQQTLLARPGTSSIPGSACARRRPAEFLAGMSAPASAKGSSSSASTKAECAGRPSRLIMQLAAEDCGLSDDDPTPGPPRKALATPTRASPRS